MYDGVGDAAEQRPTYAPPSMAANYDQVRRPFLGDLLDDLGGIGLQKQALIQCPMSPPLSSLRMFRIPWPPIALRFARPGPERA